MGACSSRILGGGVDSGCGCNGGEQRREGGRQADGDRINLLLSIAAGAKGRTFERRSKPYEQPMNYP